MTETITSFSGSPRLIKGSLVLLDLQTSVVQKIIALQYNLVTINRWLIAPEEFGHQEMASF